jgi:membrane-associated HD superfamily phosphohydrolase
MGAPMTSMHDDDHRSDDDGSSDDNENVASNGIGNALDAFEHSLPKVKAAAKPAAAKPQPKRDAKTKSKAKDKDKTGAGINKRKANATEIMHLPPTKQPRTQQNQSKASDEMMLKEFKDSLDQMKKSVFSKIVSTDAESVLTDKIKTAQKEIAGFVAKVNAKKKSLNRRNDATELIESLLSMRNEAFDVQLPCMKLVNNCFEVKDMDDLTSTSASWTIPDMVFKRAWKLQALIYVEALKNYRLSSDSVM